MIIKISKEKAKQEKFEEEKAQNLLENFNEEAKKQNSKYIIKLDYGIPYLHKCWWFLSSWSVQIVYIKENDYFVFITPIPKEKFKEVKSILEEIPDKFSVEVR